MQVNTKNKKGEPPEKSGANKKMTRIENLKDYINKEIVERGFNETGTIKIDFADLGTEEETKAAIEELEYMAEPAEGQGVWKVSKQSEDDR